MSPQHFHSANTIKVIKESGELALSWVKTHAYALHVTNKPSEDPLKVPDPIDVHLHLPAGAQRKDGPSAGVAMVGPSFRLVKLCVKLEPSGVRFRFAVDRVYGIYQYRHDWGGKLIKRLNSQLPHVQ